MSSSSDPSSGCLSGASSAALSLLPPPTSLESFLNAARAVRAASPGCPPGTAANTPSCVFFCPGDLAEYVTRAADVLSRTPPQSLANALDTLDVVQHSLGYSAVRRQKQPFIYST